MAAEQLGLRDTRTGTLIDNRFLGTLAMIAAPMLLMEALIFGLAFGSPSPSGRLLGVLELIYLGGWACSAVGMRRARVTGKSLGSKAIFIAQMTGLLMAAIYSAQGVIWSTQNTDSLIFKLTDAAWPLSHVFMLVVGVFVWRAGVWRSWRRLAPFLCGLALPLFFASMAIGAKEIGLILFPALTAIGFIALGYAVRTTSETKASA